uniref:Putative secreted protein n=1 Tax=Ixodes ricinus TaxID=34613 RepID=A0A6B0UK30_IXORI
MMQPMRSLGMVISVVVVLAVAMAAAAVLGRRLLVVASAASAWGLMAPTLCPGSNGACCRASWWSLVSCGAGTKKHEGHDRLVGCLTPAILEAAEAGTEPGSGCGIAYWPCTV